MTMHTTLGHQFRDAAPIHMMQNNSSIQLLLLNLALLLPITSSAAIATLGCPNCGKMHVPFPLSTSPNCGHPSYKVRCTKGTLWLDTLNSSAYIITSIAPQIQQLIISPPSFNGSTCISSDFHAGGLWLDEKLPFNISSDNTVLKLNCKPLAFISAMNCSSTSICFRYMKEKQDVAARCKDTRICCSFTGGGSQNDHNIKLTSEKCAVYTSFVGLPLDTLLPVSKWTQPGIAIQWVLPPEPVCSSNLDCKKLPKSSCLPDVATRQKRCLCNTRYQWDPIDGMCSSKLPLYLSST